MKKLMIIAVFVLFALTGCDSTGTSAVTADMIQKVSDMPDIVFICCNVHESGNKQITFFDNNGAYYSCDDDAICSLPINELTEYFESGDAGFVKHNQTCDKAELQSCHEIICATADDADYALKYPEALPAVETRSVTWYGVYYDSVGEICLFPIHKEDRLTDIYSNSEQINQVYEWYKESIKLTK